MFIEEATLEDAHFLKTRLRATDRTEIKDATGLSPEKVVPLSFNVSTVAFTVRECFGTKPLAMYGVAPTPGQPRVGTVWMLCTPHISKVSRALLKQMPLILAELHELYPDALHNMARFDQNHEAMLRWIEAAGFTFGPIVHKHGKPFIYFSHRI